MRDDGEVFVCLFLLDMTVPVQGIRSQGVFGRLEVIDAMLICEGPLAEIADRQSPIDNRPLLDL